MLEHSRRWEALGAELRCARAHALGEREATASLVVAGLGDPYNTGNFWSEAVRVLAPGGHVLFTMPSFDWAERYREEERSPLDRAAFALRDGQVVYLASLIYSLDEQVRTIRAAGLTLIRFDALDISDLGIEPVSQKIRIVGASTPIVWGFLARKPMVVAPGPPSY